MVSSIFDLRWPLGHLENEHAYVFSQVKPNESAGTIAAPMNSDVDGDSDVASAPKIARICPSGECQLHAVISLRHHLCVRLESGSIAD